MPKLNQAGIIHFILLFILLAGIIAGVYLVQHTQIFKPKAAAQPIIPQIAFNLVTQTTTYRVGDIIETKLLVRSDIEEANLFVGRLTFDKNYLAVDRVDYSNTFIKNWVEQYTDNVSGTISLSGGVPSPGFKTDMTQAPGVMAKVYFKALRESESTEINFTDESAIYSNSTNVNILNTKTGAGFSIVEGVTCMSFPRCPDGYEVDEASCRCVPISTPSATPKPTQTPTPLPSPSASPSPSPSPSPTPTPCLFSGVPILDNLCPSPSPSPSPTPSPTPVPTPTPLPSPTASRVFVTSTTYSGNLGGLSGADAKCQKRAEVANLGGTWKAWLSDSKISASSRLNHYNGPYKDLQNSILISNWVDLVDGSDGPRINVTEFGNFNKGYAWTNTNYKGDLIATTNTIGGANGHCADWVSTTPTITGGVGSIENSSFNTQWTSITVISCTQLASLYCFEQGSGTSITSSSTIGDGDGNGDGKINLIDLSILLSDFNKNTGFREGIDLNKDGLINSFDFSLIRNLLIQKSVIKG